MPVINEEVLEVLEVIEVAKEVMENQSEVLAKLAEHESFAELLENLDNNSVTPNLPEVSEQKAIQSDKDLKLDRYITKFKSRIDQWKLIHGNTAPPIVWDSDYKDWVWLNRGIRREK